MGGIATVKRRVTQRTCLPSSVPIRWITALTFAPSGTTSVEPIIYKNVHEYLPLYCTLIQCFKGGANSVLRTCTQEPLYLRNGQQDLEGGNLTIWYKSCTMDLCNDANSLVSKGLVFSYSKLIPLRIIQKIIHSNFLTIRSWLAVVGIIIDDVRHFLLVQISYSIYSLFSIRTWLCIQHACY